VNVVKLVRSNRNSVFSGVHCVGND